MKRYPVITLLAGVVLLLVLTGCHCLRGGSSSHSHAQADAAPTVTKEHAH